MSDNPLSIDRRRIPDTGSAFALYDETTGVSKFYLPCWRCGRKFEVDALAWQANNHCTCATCARELKPTTGENNGAA